MGMGMGWAGWAAIGRGMNVLVLGFMLELPLGRQDRSTEDEIGQVSCDDRLVF